MIQAENFTLGWEEGTRLAGVVMGLSVYNGIQCDVHFPPIMYKHLLRRPLGFHDLLRFDPELHGSLTRVIPNFRSLSFCSRHCQWRRCSRKAAMAVYLA